MKKEELIDLLEACWDSAIDYATMPGAKNFIRFIESIESSLQDKTPKVITNEDNGKLYSCSDKDCCIQGYCFPQNCTGCPSLLKRV